MENRGAIFEKLPLNEEYEVLDIIRDNIENLPLKESFDLEKYYQKISPFICVSVPNTNTSVLKKLSLKNDVLGKFNLGEPPRKNVIGNFETPSEKGYRYLFGVNNENDEVFCIVTLPDGTTEIKKRTGIKRSSYNLDKEKSCPLRTLLGQYSMPPLSTYVKVDDYVTKFVNISAHKNILEIGEDKFTIVF
ncbi:MAG: hypothetical protein JSV92_03280 [archaeon]|nr:MAG: hypothetical protein JSV92_03280 [archaeon]